MDFVYQNLGQFFFVFNFIVALLLYRAPYFVGRGWLIFAFLAWGARGLLWFFWPGARYGYGPSDLMQLLDLAGYAAILAAGVVWWRSRGAKPAGVSGAAAPEAESSRAISMIARNDSNSISKAEAVRDRLYKDFTEACAEDDVAAEVFKSPPYSEAVWVEVHVQEPLTEELSLRAHATVTIQPREFHRFENELTVVVNDSRKSKRYFSVIRLTPGEVGRICRFLAGKSDSLDLRPQRCRVFPWQLWRPKNKIVRVSSTPGAAGILGIAGGVLMPVPFLGVLLLIAAALVWFFVERRKRVFSLTSGKPEQEPRLLLRMDSWQVVLSSLAAHAADLKERLLGELSQGSDTLPSPRVEDRDRIQVSEEDIWYSGIDGKVERRQIVVRLRRAIGFVHLYPYGDDLYVGWDAHINGGTWIERMVGQGRERNSGRVVRAYGVGTSWHTPNEYDITDANFLLEWIHSIMTKVVQRALKDHRIDQEIDFTIVREARQGIAGSEGPAGRKQKTKKPRFRRIA